MDARMDACKEQEKVERARDIVVSEPLGGFHWGLLSRLYGPRDLGHRVFSEVFDRSKFRHTLARCGELAGILDESPSAIEAGTRLFVRDRTRRLEEARGTLEAAALRGDGAGRTVSRLSIVEALMALDAREPLEPHPRDISRWSTLAITTALKRSGTQREIRDPEFLGHVLDEVGALRDEAGDAYKRAAARVDGETKRRRVQVDVNYEAFLRGRQARR